MRFLANENFPSLAVRNLRKQGHEVVWIREDTPGISDSLVLARAIREEWLVLTQDKDFGELAFRWRTLGITGIVLFRVHPPIPEVVDDLLSRLLKSGLPLEHQFTVVEPHNIRQRALHQPAS